MLSEGTQEAVQDLTESIRKHFIYGDELDLTGDLTDPQTWEDFLLGAATAGIMNAPATIANNVAINNYGKNLDVDYRDYSEGIDTDQTHYTNPADAKEAQGLQRMAEEYAAMQRQGKFVNNRDKAEYDMRLWEWQNRMAEEQKARTNRHFRPRDNRLNHRNRQFNHRNRPLKIRNTPIEASKKTRQSLRHKRQSRTQTSNDRQSRAYSRNMNPPH